MTRLSETPMMRPLSIVSQKTRQIDSFLTSCMHVSVMDQSPQPTPTKPEKVQPKWQSTLLSVSIQDPNCQIMQAVKGGKGAEGGRGQSRSAQKSSGYSDAIFPQLLNEQVDKYG